MDTATKTGMDAAKIASKRVVQKTAEATGDLIGNKIADKITSIGKPKEIEEIYIPPEKRFQNLLLKNGLKSMINEEEITMLIKKLESKH